MQNVNRREKAKVCNKLQEVELILLMEQNEYSPKSAMHSTGTTIFFRTLGREAKPSWANRIIKDVNDLNYDLPKAGFFTSTRQSNKKKMMETLKYRSKSVNVSSHPTPKYIVDSLIQPEVVQLNRAYLPTSKPSGLCKFQFRNTIQGRIESKKSYHLSFDKNKISRSVNIHRLYYDPDATIDNSYAKEKRYSKSRYSRLRELKKHHDFRSYPDRHIFEDTHELDRIFDVQRCKDLSSPQRIKQTIVPLQTIPGRKEEPPLPSSLISYDISKGLKQIYQEPAHFSIKKSPRKFKIPPQVINEKRGCYR